MNGITVTVDTTPQHAEELTRVALAGEGFGILTEIDVAAIFAAKLDVHRPPLKILGACNPMLAHTAISHDPSAALLLPCNVVIEQGDHGVTVTAADPRHLLDGDGLDELAADAAARLQRALDQVAAAMTASPA